jgi:hypothetical protein
VEVAFAALGELEASPSKRVGGKVDLFFLSKSLGFEALSQKKIN